MDNNLSFITVVALLFAVIAVIYTPKLNDNSLVKQVSINPLIRFLLYFAIAFMVLKVMAFAMVAGLLAVIVTYLLEMFYFNDTVYVVTKEPFGNSSQQSNNSIDNDNSFISNRFVFDNDERNTVQDSVSDSGADSDGDGKNVINFETNNSTKQDSSFDVVGYDGSSNKYASI